MGIEITATQQAMRSVSMDRLFPKDIKEEITGGGKK